MSKTVHRGSFDVVWERPCGRFGFTTIEDCAAPEEAAEHFFDHVRGNDLPADVQITAIRRVS